MQCGHCTGAQPLNVLYVKVRGAGSIERTPRKVKRGAPEHVLDSIARISASSTRIPEEPAADAKTRLEGTADSEAPFHSARSGRS